MDDAETQLWMLMCWINIRQTATPLKTRANTTRHLQYFQRMRVRCSVIKVIEDLRVWLHSVPEWNFQEVLHTDL